MIFDNRPSTLSRATSREFIDGYHRFGRRSVDGADGTCWLQHGRFALMRFPAFKMGEPSRDELRRLFRSLRTPIVSYIRAMEPSETPNSYLYIRKGPYSRRDLARKPRQSVNRAHKYLTFSYLDWQTLAHHGLQVYCDTRARVGLSDGVESVFRRELTFFENVPGHSAFGAWKDDRLIAFIIGAAVDDYYTLAMTCSSNDSLKWCPNNALFDGIFDLFLNERGCRLVSAGLSSLQQTQRRENLHRFKLHVGFDAIKVRRCFAVNPWFRPFINRFVYRGALGLQKMFPGNPLIRKGVGVYEIILGLERHMEEM